jgi:hypothetical protein
LWVYVSQFSWWFFRNMFVVHYSLRISELKAWTPLCCSGWLGYPSQEPGRNWFF